MSRTLETAYIPISHIHSDWTLNPCERDEAHIRTLANHINRDGYNKDYPLIVFRIKDVELLQLTCGFHRFEATQLENPDYPSLPLKEVYCEIREGTWQEMVRCMNEDNFAHSPAYNSAVGRAPSREALRKMRLRLMLFPDTFILSDRALANRWRCDHKAIGSLRDMIIQQFATGEFPPVDVPEYRFLKAPDIEALQAIIESDLYRGLDGKMRRRTTVTKQPTNAEQSEAVIAGEKTAGEVLGEQKAKASAETEAEIAVVKPSFQNAVETWRSSHVERLRKFEHLPVGRTPLIESEYLKTYFELAQPRIPQNTKPTAVHYEGAIECMRDLPVDFAEQLEGRHYRRIIKEWDSSVLLQLVERFQSGHILGYPALQTDSDENASRIRQAIRDHYGFQGRITSQSFEVLFEITEDAHTVLVQLNPKEWMRDGHEIAWAVSVLPEPIDTPSEVPEEQPEETVNDLWEQVKPAISAWKKEREGVGHASKTMFVHAALRYIGLPSDAETTSAVLQELLQLLTSERDILETLIKKQLQGKSLWQEWEDDDDSDVSDPVDIEAVQRDILKARAKVSDAEGGMFSFRPIANKHGISPEEVGRIASEMAGSSFGTIASENIKSSEAKTVADVLPDSEVLSIKLVCTGNRHYWFEDNSLTPDAIPLSCVDEEILVNLLLLTKDIKRLDAAAGEFVRAIEQIGLGDNTILYALERACTHYSSTLESLLMLTNLFPDRFDAEEAKVYRESLAAPQINAWIDTFKSMKRDVETGENWMDLLKDTGEV